MYIFIKALVINLDSKMRNIQNYLNCKSSFNHGKQVIVVESWLIEIKGDKKCSQPRWIGLNTNRQHYLLLCGGNDVI